MSNRPSFRQKSQTFARWIRTGYRQDPAMMQVRDMRHLDFERINNFYKSNVQGQNVVIALMGDPKTIDVKSIEAKYGKMKKVAKNKLFSSNDLEF